MTLGSEAESISRGLQLLAPLELPESTLEPLSSLAVHALGMTLNFAGPFRFGVICCRQPLTFKSLEPKTAKGPAFHTCAVGRLGLGAVAALACSA